MSKNIFIYTLIVSSIFLACETEFSGDYEFGEPTIVIEGWITNLDEPQRIIVSQSFVGKHNDSSGFGVPIGDLIDDAIVIICLNI